MWMGVHKAELSVGALQSAPRGVPGPAEPAPVRGGSSSHWSLVLSSSREPEADGGSLKYSNLRRQKWGGFWRILVGQGRVDESGHLSPKLNHQHLLAECREWLFAGAV